MTSDEAREPGKLGGKATASKGKAYMSELGKKGFKALCRKFPGNSRARAVRHLNGNGNNFHARYLPRPDPDSAGAGFDAMIAEIGLDSPSRPPEIPF
jgi:hypothetical protein